MAIARRHIDASPYRDRIEIKVGPALDTLKSLDGPFDLAFIDADKTGYLDYYEAIVPKLAPTRRHRRGQRAVERAGARRRHAPTRSTSRRRCCAQFNDHVVADERVECVMLPLRDGVTWCRRTGGDALLGFRGSCNVVPPSRTTIA